MDEPHPGASPGALEEAVMQETKRVAEEANRMGQEALEQARRIGDELQQAAVGGFETAGGSFE